MVVWVGEGRAARESVVGVGEPENLEDPQQQKLQCVHGSGASYWFPQWCKHIGSSAAWCTAVHDEVLRDESRGCPAPENAAEVLSSEG